MAAYRWVYDPRHLLADCQVPGSAPEPYIRSAIEYGLFLMWILTMPPHLKYAATLPSNLSSVACCQTIIFHKVVWQHMQGVVGLLITAFLQIHWRIFQ